MYIIRDPVGPKVRMHKEALAFKNVMLNHFPRTAVDGVDTFGTMYTWIAGQGIQESHSHLKVYRQLGMKLKDMRAQSYSDLDYTYIHLGAYTAPNGAISQDDIRNYIQTYSPLIYPMSQNKFNPDPVSSVDLNPDDMKNTADAKWDNNGWITSILTYTPTELSLIDNLISDAAIIQKVKDISSNEIFYDPHKNSRLTALAIFDLNTNAIFETQIVVKQKTVSLKNQSITSRNIGRVTGVPAVQMRYVSSAYIELKFRRIVDVPVSAILQQNAIDLLNLIETNVDMLLPLSKVREAHGFRDIGLSIIEYVHANNVAKSQVKSLSSSVYKQLVVMANWVNPYVNDALIQGVDPVLTTEYYSTEQSTHIKVDGLIDLPPIEFRKTFLSLLKFDYKVHEKKGHWYDKVVTIFIVFVAIAAAAFGQFEISGWALAAATASTVAIAEGLWAMYLVKNGGSMSAISFTLKVANVSGIVSMVAGVTAIYNAWQKALLEAELRQAIATAISEEVAGTGSQAAIDSAANAYISAINSGQASMYGSLFGTVIQGFNSVVEFGKKLGVIDDNKTTAVLGMASGGYEFLTQNATNSVAEVTLDKLADAGKEGIVKFFSKPLSEVMNQCVNWINSAFNAYIMFISPPNEGLSDKMAQLENIQKEVENTSPDNMENMWTVYTDPYGNIFEVGDYVDKVYPMLTVGKNRSLMNQCYDSGYKI